MGGICKKSGIFISKAHLPLLKKREPWDLQNNNSQINDDLDFFKYQVIKHTIILRSPTLRGFGFFCWKTHIAGWSDRKKKQQNPCQNHIKGLDLKVKNMIPSEVAEPHPKDSTSLPISAYWFIATQDKLIGRCMKVCAVQTTVRRAFFCSPKENCSNKLAEQLWKRQLKVHREQSAAQCTFQLMSPHSSSWSSWDSGGFKFCCMLMLKIKWQHDLFFSFERADFHFSYII